MGGPAIAECHFVYRRRGSRGRPSSAHSTSLGMLGASACLGVKKRLARELADAANRYCMPVPCMATT